MENKWDGLTDGTFEFVDLGREAEFVLPVTKLGLKFQGISVEEMVHDFLVRNFSKAFTVMKMESFGVWMNGRLILEYDESKLYKVAFLGKELIAKLGGFLAQIAVKTNEECIYFKAGQYSSLIYPKK